MSYARQAMNGYSNGAVRRYDLNGSSVENSADERSRSRPGYGTYGRQQQPDQVHAMTRLERGQATRRSRERNSWSKSRSRSRPGARYGAAGGQVDGQSVWTACISSIEGEAHAS